MKNKTRLAFANEKKCRHADALKEQGFISWTMYRNRFYIGDIVYLFMSDDRYVRFKTVVVEADCERGDTAYWIIPAPKDKTYKLKLIAEYEGDELGEEVLARYGFKGGKSLERTICNKLELLDYIQSVF